MKDLIISAIANNKDIYGVNKVYEYVKSIDTCGFTGDKIMVCYPVPQETIDFLKKYGWEVYSFELNNQHPHMKRLIDIYTILRQIGHNYRYVISTDVRDVVFQTNPSEYLEANLKKQIMVSSENVLYKDEPFGRGNIIEGYGHLLLDRFGDTPTNNVGVLAGHSSSMKDLFLINYLVSLAGNTIHYTDQSSYNFIVNSEFMKDVVQVETNQGNWAIQLGTSQNPKLLTPYEFQTNDNMVTNNGNPFCIVHQYDRFPVLNTMIKNKYK